MEHDIMINNTFLEPVIVNECGSSQYQLLGSTLIDSVLPFQQNLGEHVLVSASTVRHNSSPNVTICGSIYSGS